MTDTEELLRLRYIPSREGIPEDLGLDSSEGGYLPDVPTCDCCGRFALHLLDGEDLWTDRDRLLVYAIPGVLLSIASCRECLREDRWPYAILVGQAACVIDTDSTTSWVSQLAPWFREVVNHNLSLHEKTWGTFLNDVRDDVRAMNEYLVKNEFEDAPAEEISLGCPVCSSGDGGGLDPSDLLCSRSDCPYLGSSEI